MSLNFPQLFNQMGFDNATSLAVTQQLKIYSFEQFKGRHEIIQQLIHATLGFISRDQQERLIFALTYLTTHCGAGGNWDKWIEENGFDAATLTEYIVSNTPAGAPVLRNRRMVDGLLPGEQVLVGETAEGRTMVYRATRQPVLDRCTVCAAVPADWAGLMKCKCGKFVYCSYTCQKVHWRIHGNFCRRRRQT